MPSIRVAVALLLAAVPGWVWAGELRPVETHHRTPVAKTQPKMSDAQLEAAIRAKFAKSKINADKFQVHVQGGIATIEGKTDVTQHKGVATRLAKTGGAAAVNNHIQISEEAREKSAANLEKGRRRVQIKRGEARSDASQPRQSPGR